MSDRSAVAVPRTAERSPIGELDEFAERMAGVGRWRIDLKAWRIAWSAGLGDIFARAMPEAGSFDLDEHIGFYHPDDRHEVRAGLRAAASCGRSPT